MNVRQGKTLNWRSAAIVAALVLFQDDIFRNKYQCQLTTSEPVASLQVELDEMSNKVLESFTRKILAKLRSDKLENIAWKMILFF